MGLRQGEGWLAKPDGEPPKPILHCVLATSKPKLDGRLDEPCWKQAKGAAITDLRRRRDGARQATVKLAYDSEFLYLACQCRKTPGGDETAGTRRATPTCRATIVSKYCSTSTATSRATIGSRSTTGDGPATIAGATRRGTPPGSSPRRRTDETWTVEAAIPLDQLTGRYPRAGDVWALGVQRIVPGVGLQSWNSPASTDIRPEGFGYLIFR